MKGEVSEHDDELRKEILAVLKECQYDFDYGYSKAVGWLHVKMVDRNKTSYKLVELFNNQYLKTKQ